MRIRDLLLKTNFEEVSHKIILHYGIENIKNLKKTYEKLKNSNTDIRNSSMTIIIQAFKEINEEPVPISSFTEDDSDLYFDVSAYSYNDDTVYSISTVDKDEFLNYNISKETLNKFSYSSIMAHCLWEITSYSYE